ncbi:hypothetical protein JVU11DRAFT_7001 [Chiua virens]|nr:hypothetical protein JVU11DRAFT_7001 [Chiua virens]
MAVLLMDLVANNLLDIGAITLDDYLSASITPQPQPSDIALDVDAITRLHQTCQRIFRTTDPLKFEFVDHGLKSKQCILTITKPDGAQRSYITQPVFAKKNEAKSQAAKIAIDMGALDFLSMFDEVHLHEDVNAVSVAISDEIPAQSVQDIEAGCREWRAGHVTPHWAPFPDPKLMHKQGCALRIQLSSHVLRVYLADPTFDSFSDAQDACAKVAISEGVLDFIKHGNGQTRPSSPSPVFVPTTLLPPAVTPWTLQTFYDSLPRPFPESFETNDASEINALGWLNTMVQHARGGKLIMSFFFTSDGPPGLHGCLLKLDRPGGYKASLVDARFIKRSEAKAAVCLQAMSEGIGDYIRAIASAVDNKTTTTMRSFSSSLVYPALTSELTKIDASLHPHFEYNRERDAFGASLILKLSTDPTSEQVRRYTVPADYRNKADAKVAVICHAAELGAVEFVRFRGGSLPDGYVSLYTLQAYNPDVSRKRKQPGSTEDLESAQSTKKKKKRGHKRAGGRGSSGGQTHDISGPDDMGLPQSIVPMDRSCDPSQSGVEGERGSGTARLAGFPSYGAPIPVPMTYPAVLDPRFAAGGADVHLSGEYGGATVPPARELRALPGSSSRRPVEPAELEPGEVVSVVESDFSVSSSRHEDEEADEGETDASAGAHVNDVEHVARNKVKGKEKETSPSTAGSTTASQDRLGSFGNGMKEERECVNVERVARSKGKEKATSPATSASTTLSQGHPSRSTTMAATSHVDKLIAYCSAHNCDTPSFHEVQRQGRFQVWIVIGKERFDLPSTYESAEEGRQRVAKQVLARLTKGRNSARDV